MLIALMTILFLGGGGSSAVLAYVADSHDAVKDVMVDDQRRDDVLETLKEFKSLAKEQNKASQNILKQLREELREHAPSDAKVESAWTSHYRQLRETNAEAVELRFRLREQLSREEWEQIFADRR